MDHPLFPTLDEVLEIHTQQIELYGGSDGVRDPAGLESAVAMPIPKTIIIDGSEFAVLTQQVPGSIFKAAVGTNCPQGGETRAGGRTVLVLEDMSAI